MENAETSPQTPGQQAEPAQQSPRPSRQANRESQRRPTTDASAQALERTTKAPAAIQPSVYRADPFAAIRRFSEDMNQVFSDFFGPSVARWGMPEWGGWGGINERMFWPELDVQHRGDKLVIRADLPGLQRQDITIEARDHELNISGERRAASEQPEGRYYRAERSYGRFSRSIPLPKGAKPETASATFQHGVLQIEMDAPNEEMTQGRRIEVREGSPR